MPEPDPNWLLSTTAQSTAALVAIVGGFLLSRVLAFAAERNGLALREAQLREEVRLAEETYHFTRAVSTKTTRPIFSATLLAYSWSSPKPRPKSLT